MKPFEVASPSWVVLQLNEECNLRCTMCYEWGEAGAYHDRPELAALELDVALRIIDECPGAKFELFGGEPLLYPAIWDVIRRIKQRRGTLSFPTNGTLLDRHAAQLVADPPDRLWISLDGPPEINDAQRGRGVFKRVMRGLGALIDARRAAGATAPTIGITCVVTPINYRHLEELFTRVLDLSQLDAVSLELQSYATDAQFVEYAAVMRRELGVATASHAAGYVRDPAMFAGVDRDVLLAQLQAVRAVCDQRGLAFYSQPRTLERANLDAYLRGAWRDMADYHARCAVPWTYAEISARGEVTTCHTFYDAALGNVHDQPLLEIWRGDRAGKLRGYLRTSLLPICTACCRFYQ